MKYVDRDIVWARCKYSYHEHQKVNVQEAETDVNMFLS